MGIVYRTGPSSRRSWNGPFTTDLDLIDWLTEIGAAPGWYPNFNSDAYLDAPFTASTMRSMNGEPFAAAATALGFAGSRPPEPEMIVKPDLHRSSLHPQRSGGMVLIAGTGREPGHLGRPPKPAPGWQILN